jgi:hypothetical protein
MLNALLTQSLDDELGGGLGNNKSCAISSLVAQANFIFPHWYVVGFSLLRRRTRALPLLHSRPPLACSRVWRRMREASCPGVVTRGDPPAAGTAAVTSTTRIRNKRELSRARRTTTFAVRKR